MVFDDEIHQELSYRAWRGIRVAAFTAALFVVGLTLVERLATTPHPEGSDSRKWLLFAMALAPFATRRSSPRSSIYVIAVLVHWLIAAHVLNMIGQSGGAMSPQFPSLPIGLMLATFMLPLPIYWFLLAWTVICAWFWWTVQMATPPTVDPEVLFGAYRGFYLTALVSFIGARFQVRDVTEVVHVRRALRDESQRRVVVYERSRIARDLHDHVGARLTGIALRAERDQRRLPPEAAETLSWTRSVIHLCLEELRDSIWALNHQEREAQDLLASVRRRVEDSAQEFGLQLRWASNDDNWQGVLVAPVALVVNSIVREALTNVARHAKATELSVLMHHGGDDLLLEISDNGVGLIEQPGQGRGLHNLRTRAAELGGTTVVVNRVPRGVTVRSWIPLRRGALPPDDREVPWPDSRA